MDGMVHGSPFLMVQFTSWGDLMRLRRQLLIGSASFQLTLEDVIPSLVHSAMGLSSPCICPKRNASFEEIEGAIPNGIPVYHGIPNHKHLFLSYVVWMVWFMAAHFSHLGVIS